MMHPTPYRSNSAQDFGRPAPTSFTGRLLKSTVAWMIVTLFGLLAFFSSPSMCDDDLRAGFVPGEKLHYKLRWGFIPAGEAELEVLPIEQIEGIPRYHFVLQARTNAFIDVFYRFRTRIDAYADINMTRSVKYVKNTEVKNKHKVDTVVFDWHRKQAHYHQKEVLAGSPPEIKIETRTTPLMEGTFDPLSAFYFTRTNKLGEDFFIDRPVTDGKKCLVAKAAVLKRQQIRLNGTSYDTYVILPELEDLSGVFEKSPDARMLIWISADRLQIPLRLKSKVVVGSFIGELVEIERAPANGTGTFRLGKTD